jgi:hypothetical protein
VASIDHVRKGVAQACHGKASPLQRMSKGDFIIYYSGKQTLGKPELCQEFTAIGKVKMTASIRFNCRKTFVHQDETWSFIKARMFPFFR